MSCCFWKTLHHHHLSYCIFIQLHLYSPGSNKSLIKLYDVLSSVTHVILSMSIGSTFNVVKCHLSNVFRNEFTYVKTCGAFARRHQSAICILQDGFHRENVDVNWMNVMISKREGVTWQCYVCNWHEIEALGRSSTVQLTPSNMYLCTVCMANMYLEPAALNRWKQLALLCPDLTSSSKAHYLHV